MLGRQLQDQAAPIAQGEQVSQEQEHPQVGALAIDISSHPAQGVGQLLPGQARKHPGVGAQGIAVEAGGPGCFQSLEIAGLGFFYAAGEIQRPAAGAVRELQQGPAVVDQLQAIPQAGEGGVLQPGGLGRQCRWRSETAGCGCLAAVGGGHWVLFVVSALARSRG